MNKDLKDYLHLYFGCECRYRLLVQGTDFDWHDAIIDTRALYSHLQKLWEVKPVLRPLSDLTNVEAHTIYSKYFGKETAEDWSGDTGSAYFNPKRVLVRSEHALRIINGEDYEAGDFMKVIELVPYLLSKRFDLFGLIESGLAIDKTKIPHTL